jgi:hypothetical protein
MKRFVSLGFNVWAAKLSNDPTVNISRIETLLLRSNRHGRKRSYTEKYDDLHGPVLRPFISVSYTEKCGDIRRKKNDRLLSQYTEAIYGLRFAPYMIVLLRIRARRYTIVIRDHVIRQNTVVYGGIRTVYGRLRAYTDSVIVDLGISQYSAWIEKKRIIHNFWQSCVVLLINKY